ncbi:MAG: HEAT repeat domain-containing protein [Verrucomicrobia bacterium]|nr:HEAT repeat domain-containing protein [Verrucomicrobiota bacterium]
MQADSNAVAADAARTDFRTTSGIHRQGEVHMYILKKEVFMKRILLLALPAFSLFGISSEEEGARRVQAHLLIEDSSSALEEARKFSSLFPESKIAGSALVEALAANGMEEEALDAWHRLSAQYPDVMTDRHLLEELSWGVLRKGVESSQYGVRLTSLIGAYLTRDARAVQMLVQMMRDSNAIIRSVAVQMSTSYADAILKDEIARLLSEERVWMVRLEAIQAAGQLRIKWLVPKLQAFVTSDKSTFEERGAAIEALVRIYDRIELPELQKLAESNRAGLRHLACMLASHFAIPEAKEAVLKLIRDPNPDVRIAAVNAFGLYYREKMSAKEAKEAVDAVLSDSDPAVAITAAWAAILIDPSFGEPYMARWLSDPLPENRRLASAALATTGGRSVQLGIKTLKESTDPYVRANIAQGLLGQRVEVAACCDMIYEFLQTEKRMWMRDNRRNPLFSVLAPSQVRHIDQIPNYPEAIDHMTRLEIISLLAIVEDARALGALKTFLQRKAWGVTGFAAATLLQEGDETALEIVRELLKDSDPNVRLQACLVLAMMGRDEAVVKDLQAAYAGAGHEKKLHILEALGRIGQMESLNFLIGTLREPFPILRASAAAALIQTLNK